jgi:hypothetical protein
MSVELVDRPVASDAPGEAQVRRGLRARLTGLFRKPDPVELERERVLRLSEARALLERAREVVAAGWVQDAFYVVRDPQGRLRPVSPFGLLMLSHADVAGACLVGAVAHASSGFGRQDRRGPAALAVDTLWDTLGEQAGRWDPQPAAQAPHPAARASRVRDLAQWNDEPQRTRQDVLDLIDRSVSRTILSSVR